MAALSFPLAGGAQEREIPLYTGHLTGDLDRHLRQVSRNKPADTITGGLSRPGKMPCPALGLPANRCKVGSALDRVEGAVCYAKKGNYRRDTVRLAPALQVGVDQLDLVLEQAVGLAEGHSKQGNFLPDCPGRRRGMLHYR